LTSIYESEAAINLKLLLEDTAGRYGGKTAVVSNDRRISYAELNEVSNKVANALIKLGIAKGDRAAILLPNSPEFVFIYFGIVKSGGIAVPLDIKYKIDELASLFDDCQPRFLIIDSASLKQVAPTLSRLEHIEHVIDLSSEYGGQFLSYQDIMAVSSAQRVQVEIESQDIALIAYTSGPTFRPRGAVLTHQNLVAEAAMMADAFQQTDKDAVILFALPMYHVFSLIGILLTSVGRGSTVVIVHGLSISHVLEIIERERATIFVGVPYVYALAVVMAERERIHNDLSSLRLLVSGGASLPINITERFKKHYDSYIADVWGLTEAACLVTVPPIDGVRKPGSVGKAIGDWKVKIVDDNGNELPTNQPGEVIVEGPIMERYHHNPQATAEVIKNGWLYTGDIGRIDEDGYLFILGRKKDIIIRKGQNIFPSDIEEILRLHPKVAGAVVTGAADEMRGEAVRAIIRLKEGVMATEEEIRRFCRKYMADYKLPTQIEFSRSLPKKTG